MKKHKYDTIPTVSAFVPNVPSSRIVKLVSRRAKLASKVEQTLRELPKLRDVEDGYIKSVAKIVPNQTKCAAVLGISPITLNKRLSQLGIHISSGHYTHN